MSDSNDFLDFDGQPMRCVYEIWNKEFHKMDTCGELATAWNVSSPVCDEHSQSIQRKRKTK